MGVNFFLQEAPVNLPTPYGLANPCASGSTGDNRSHNRRRDEIGSQTFSFSRMWKKARRSIDSFPVDLYSGGKVRCPFVWDSASDIVGRKMRGSRGDA